MFGAGKKIDLQDRQKQWQTVWKGIVEKFKEKELTKRTEELTNEKTKAMQEIMQQKLIMKQTASNPGSTSTNPHRNTSHDYAGYGSNSSNIYHDTSQRHRASSYNSPNSFTAYGSQQSIPGNGGFNSTASSSSAPPVNPTRSGAPYTPSERSGADNSGGTSTTQAGESTRRVSPFDDFNALDLAENTRGLNTVELAVLIKKLVSEKGVPNPEVLFKKLFSEVTVLHGQYAQEQAALITF